jgi:hypothetical protein
MSIRRSMRSIALIACGAVAAALVAFPASAGERGPQPEITTIADGFVAPLGLAVDRRGNAYVVEAFTGNLTRVNRRGDTTTVYTATDGGLPGGVAVHDGTVLFTRFIAPGPEDPPSDTTLEVLLEPNRSRTIASLLTYEQEQNPDAGNTYGFADLSAECLAQLPEDVPQPQPYPGIIESNPYAVAVHRGAALIADAAGNSILRVTRDGRISTVAVLPPVPQTVTAQVAEDLGLPDCTVGEIYRSEPVPTDVEVGRDGDLYVTSLPGGPEGLGAGSVFRINPRTGTVRRVATGFLGAVDLAVGRDGTIYVADLFGNTISAVRHGRVRTVAEVTSPGTVEIGRHGTLYVTVNVFEGEAPGNGTLIRIRLGGRGR